MRTPSLRAARSANPLAGGAPSGLAEPGPKVPWPASETLPMKTDSSPILPRPGGRLPLRSLCIAGCAWLAAAAVQAATFTGLVYPVKDITLSAGVSGIVQSRLVQPGQRVQRGQAVVSLDDQTQTIESSRRKAILDDGSELASSRERVRILSELFTVAKSVFDRTGSVSKDEVLRLEAELTASRGRVEQLEAQKKRERLEYEAAEQERRLRHYAAPIAGTVSKIFPEVGEWVKPGDPLLHLVDASTGVLQLTVPLKEARSLQAGQPLAIRFETHLDDAPTTGRVDFVSPVADPASGLVVVRVHFPNSNFRIRPGVKGTVELGPAQPGAAK
jgi:RND family efflux transporter MFP subunit